MGTNNSQLAQLAKRLLQTSKSALVRLFPSLPLLIFILLAHRYPADTAHGANTLILIGQHPLTIIVLFLMLCGTVVAHHYARPREISAATEPYFKKDRIQATELFVGGVIRLFFKKDRLRAFTLRTRLIAYVSTLVFLIGLALIIGLLWRTSVTRVTQSALAAQITHHPEYRNNFEATFLADRSPISSSLVKLFTNLSAHLDKEGLYDPLAAMLLAQYKIYCNQHEAAVQLVIDALRVPCDSSQTLDLIDLGVQAIIIGQLTRSYGRGIEWVEQGIDLSDIPDYDARKASLRLNKCALLLALCAADIGTFTPTAVRECYDKLPATDIRHFGTTNYCISALNLADAAVVEHVRRLGPLTTQPTELEQDSLEQIIASIESLDPIIANLPVRRRSQIMGQQQLLLANLCLWSSSYNRCVHFAAAAERAFEKVEDYNNCAKVRQIASRAYRHQDRFDEAKKELNLAEAWQRKDGFEDQALHGAISLAKASLIIDSGEAGVPRMRGEVSPGRAAADFIWNEIETWQTHRDYCAMLVKGLLQLANDGMLSDLPPYWERVLMRAKELGIVT